MLTPPGEKLFNYPNIKRQKEVIKLILSHTAFPATLKLYLYKGLALWKTDIVEIMKQSNLHGVDSATTYARRASTIIGLNNWIIKQAE